MTTASLRPLRPRVSLEMEGPWWGCREDPGLLQHPGSTAAGRPLLGAPAHLQLRPTLGLHFLPQLHTSTDPGESPEPPPPCPPLPVCLATEKGKRFPC